jgi:hypothetical protein
VPSLIPDNEATVKSEDCDIFAMISSAVAALYVEKGAL